MLENKGGKRTFIHKDIYSFNRHILAATENYPVFVNFHRLSESWLKIASAGPMTNGTLKIQSYVFESMSTNKSKVRSTFLDLYPFFYLNTDFD